MDEMKKSAEDAEAVSLLAEEEEEASAGVADESGETSRMRQEIADLRDRSMRTLADFDNYRKRAERERLEHRRYALAEPLREMLTVMDNLDLALRADGSDSDLRGGVELIARQLAELLRRFGVQEVQAVGRPFDPTRHEAVSRREDPAVTTPTVARELRRGYQLHDRLLRPAMVEVAVPAEGAAAEADDGGSTAGDV